MNVVEKISGALVAVKWFDSSFESGWQDISDYTVDAIELNYTSYGIVVYEDNNVIALAHNVSDNPKHKSANGIMRIPKVSVTEIIPITL